ncbi:MAG: DUF262 domain-containing HNH endonuclease family protein [Dehalococcoidia bacterium]
MASDKLEAAPITLHDLLEGEKEFRAPVFQRRYVWAKKHLDTLWEDIDAILDGEDARRFLGALVLQDRSSGLAFAPKSYWMVDGQQRITTLYLTLLAIARSAERNGDVELADQIVKRYLLNQSGQNRHRPKIRPTNRDLRQFAVVVSSLETEEAELPEGFGEESEKMTQAYARLEAEVANRVKRGGNGSLKTLATALLESLGFVQISLSDEQDPHQVFDRLNDAGEDLGTIDLVRNVVFAKFGDEYQRAESFYNTKWRPSFEDSLASNIDGFFFPFTLAHEPDTTKSQVFSTLKKRWTTAEPAAIFEELIEFVSPYKALVVGEALETSGLLADAIARLQRMPAPTVIYPFAMRVIHAALNGTLEASRAAQNLALIEAFLVRRSVSGFEATGLHSIFKDLWKSTQGDPHKVLERIQTSTIRLPDDATFCEDIKTKGLYGRRLTPYILLEYELGLEGARDRLSPQTLRETMTVDHVLPQDYGLHIAELMSKKTHENIVHTWANLVPLSGPLNSSKGDRPWSEIRDDLRTETVFATTKRLAERQETWNADEIGKRAESLCRWALTRWPRTP